MALNNYDGLIDPREHIQNVHDNLELVVQDNHNMCKILPTSFKGLVRVWYNNLEPASIINFNDLYTKLVARSIISIPVKKNSTKLFGITQVENESTMAYLKWFNEEMLKVEDMMEPVASKTLISGVKDKILWRELYAMLDKRLLTVK